MSRNIDQGIADLHQEIQDLEKAIARQDGSAVGSLHQGHSGAPICFVKMNRQSALFLVCRRNPRIPSLSNFRRHPSLAGDVTSAAK